MVVARFLERFVKVALVGHLMMKDGVYAISFISAPSVLLVAGLARPATGADGLGVCSFKMTSSISLAVGVALLLALVEPESLPAD